MPGTSTSRYYFGDFRLLHHGDDHVEDPQLLPAQEHQGVDQDRTYLVPSSPNASLNVLVTCIGVAHPTVPNAQGFKAQVAALRRAREARAERLDALSWVARDDLSGAVSAWAAPVLTVPGNAYAVADVLLVRRPVVGAWSLLTVTGLPGGPGQLQVAAVAGTSLHALAAADTVHLVEAYYVGMRWAATEPVAPGQHGAWVAERLRYAFRGSGRYTYSRTASNVGS